MTDSLQTSTGTSFSAVIAAFIPSLVTALLFMLIFVLVRKPFRRIYSPRTYIDLIPEKLVPQTLQVV
ncbi:hypothetical protein I5L01_15520, partial [Erythrobacter sp. YJ-T3-07]|nr:hypothetical protein [Erythrobacter sp. YJ-T3-07]